MSLEADARPVTVPKIPLGQVFCGGGVLFEERHGALGATDGLRIGDALRRRRAGNSDHRHCHSSQREDGSPAGRRHHGCPPHFNVAVGPAHKRIETRCVAHQHS